MADRVAHSTAIFEKVAVRFILDGWYMKEYEGQDITRFLRSETEERWQIPHYFATAFDRESSREEAFNDLASIFFEAAEDDILLKGYLKQTEELLQQTLKPEVLTVVEDMFKIYRQVRDIKASSDDDDEKQRLIELLTKDHEYLSDWSQI